MYYRILVASQRFHGAESLTYASTEKLALGQIVQIPLQRKSVLGVVEGTATKPSFATKPLLRSWDLKIPAQSLALIDWLRDYYPAPLGGILELFTPPALTQKVDTADSAPTNPVSPSLPRLTPEQESVLKRVSTSGSKFLLHGDTGTGKTRVYLELAKETLAAGKSAIILTPEIGLTGPLLETFTQTFGSRVIVTHSAMTASKRRETWVESATSQQPLIIIGPRSAIFTPVQQLGLIILDEAHDSAYKQEQTPYYQTSRVAGKLAELHNAKLVLGSATPPISDYFVFQKKNLPILRMETPAIQSEHTSDITVIDQKDRTNFSRSPWLCNQLLTAIEQALAAHEQSILFLNRRGSARLVLCENCGWQAMCPHCDVALTFHADQHLMRCHSCDFSQVPPSICPDCGVSELVYKSIGTKALEAELSRLFPNARISRFDRDTNKAERLHLQHDNLQAGTTDIIIGTQAIAKGFDLPKLSVVGVVSADSGFQIPDFTANERSFQLISQVSGRVGRGHRAGKLYVQSYQPDNPILQLALAKDYAGFLAHELKQRKIFQFPPYFHLAKITCLRATSKSAQAACLKLADQIRGTHTKVIIEGPAPRFTEKIAGRHGWHIILKAKHREVLTDIAKILPSNTVCDLDPNDLL